MYSSLLSKGSLANLDVCHQFADYGPLNGVELDGAMGKTGLMPIPV